MSKRKTPSNTESTTVFDSLDSLNEKRARLMEFINSAATEDELLEITQVYGFGCKDLEVFKMQPDDIIGIIFGKLPLKDFKSTCLVNKRWFKLSHRYYDLSYTDLKMAEFIRGSISNMCEISDIKYKQLKLNQTFDYDKLGKTYLNFYPQTTTATRDILHESFIDRLSYFLKYHTVDDDYIKKSITNQFESSLKHKYCGLTGWEIVKLFLSYKNDIENKFPTDNENKRMLFKTFRKLCLNREFGQQEELFTNMFASYIQNCSKDENKTD